MSKIEGNGLSTHGSSSTSYAFNPDDAGVVVSALMIQLLNAIRDKDKDDPAPRPIDQGTVDVYCRDFPSLCDYLINKTPNRHSKSVGILLKKITLASQISPEEGQKALKALHTIKQVLSKTNEMGIIENILQIQLINFC